METENANGRNIVIAAAVILAAVIIGYLVAYCVGIKTVENTGAGVYDSPTIAVHVKGAVANPGIYEFESGKRVNDAVKSAGGALENADLNGINLAEFLKDEAEIIVPFKTDTVTDPPTVTAKTVSVKININTASAEELCKLPGVGEVTSAKIIEYRTGNGGFNRIEEIMNVSGIGEKTFKSIKDYICVS